MAHNYTIQFKSLRSATVYTLAIGGGTGDAIPLTPGAQPFTTQEDDNEDVFTPVRTQSGYLRVVDDGKDANGNAWDWKDLIPATDTSRPVTLTHMIPNPDAGQDCEPDEIEVTDWVGFMQAQTFSGVLYGNPQEREFPVQCPLTVVSLENIPTANTQIQNFAYLLKTIIDTIPSTCRPTNFVIQGGNDARNWLLNRVDWMNYIEEGDTSAESRYDLMTALQDMCNYWGWCARIHSQTMYLTCIDDATETNVLLLTYTELGELASGSSTSAGSVETMASTVSIGNIFANTNNEEYQQRGHNEAVVKAESNPFDAEIMKFTGKVSELEIAQGWQNRVTEDDKTVRYTNDLLSFSVFGMSGTSVSDKASFNAAEYSDTNQSQQGIIRKGFDSYDNLIMIKAPYDGNVFASLETVYEHCFSHDFLELNGTIYQKTEEYKDEQEQVWYGNSTMYIQLGIGRTRATARWLTNTQDVWGNSPTPVKVTIGNKGTVFQIKQSVPGGISYVQYLYINEKLTGKLFIDFLGSDDIREHAGSRNFEIRDFTTTMYHDGMMQLLLGRWEDAEIDTSFQEPEATREYKAKSTSVVKDEWNVDGIYATDNDMKLGSGIIIDSDGGYFKGYVYPGSEYKQWPEQHLANRVVNYWATSKRKIVCELMAHDGTNATVASTINPRNKATINSTTTYPISIERNWRDDIVRLTLIEMPTSE